MFTEANSANKLFIGINNEKYLREKYGLLPLGEFNNKLPVFTQIDTFGSHNQSGYSKNYLFEISFKSRAQFVKNFILDRLRYDYGYTGKSLELRIPTILEFYDNPAELIKKNDIDYIVIGDDYPIEKILGKEYAKLGIILTKRIGISSSGKPPQSILQ